MRLKAFARARGRNVDMKNSFGNSLVVTLFGESHGPAVGAVLDGLAPGIEIDEDYSAEQLSLRRPEAKYGTARREKDGFSVLSGVFEGRTTGTPLTIVIENGNKNSADYEAIREIARPGHADYAAFCKYHGYEDYRGGGHFSGRLTAALVAAGAIARRALRKKNILIATHILSLGGVGDLPFEDEKDAFSVENTAFPVLDGSAKKKMKETILECAADGDSVGGVCESMIVGLPAGVGVLKWLLAALAGEYEMKRMLGPLTYSVSILLTFGVSLLVGRMVARKNKKIDMVEALKNAE